MDWAGAFIVIGVLCFAVAAGPIGGPIVLIGLAALFYKS